MKYCNFACSVIVLAVSLLSTSLATMRYHEDGSMSSNSGLTHPLQRFLFRRTKKASFINPEPRLMNAKAGSLTADQAAALVAEHNKYRRLVQSTNMQALVWDNNLAASAQAHADRCVFQHSPSPRENGENLYAGAFFDVATSVGYWFAEGGQCGCYNSYKDCCGHYTQVVWANTNKVGCGLANCGNVFYAPGQRYLFVCHYNPEGNMLVQSDDGSISAEPAFIFRKSTEPSCTACPSGTYCNNGLCEVK